MRRLAYEAADCGLISSDLAAGIRRVKGVKKIGIRLGDWLTPEQSSRLWQAATVETGVKGLLDDWLHTADLRRASYFGG